LKFNTSLILLIFIYYGEWNNVPKFIYNFQSSKSDKTVVAFMIFPTKTQNFNVESLRGQAVTKSLRETIQSIQQNIGKRMYDICLR